VVSTIYCSAGGRNGIFNYLPFPCILVPR